MSSSSPSRTSGAVCGKTDVQVAHGVQIRRSTFVWKVKEISFPMPPIPRHYQVKSQRKLSKQVDIQNMIGCCVAVFWAVGLCIVLEPIRGASKGLACP
jgi:hypothetical protein